MAQIKINNLDIQLGHSSICSSIMFTIQDKTIMTIAGDSDSGIKELVDAILGFINLNNGTITVDGVEVQGEPVFKRKFVYIPSDWALFPDLTVRQHLEFGFKLLKLKKAELNEKTEALLQKLNLLEQQNLLATKVDTLSQFKVAVGRALAVEPNLVIFDDPFLSFDSNNRRKLTKLLKHLQEEFQFTCLIVTNNALDYMGISNNLTIMSKGYIEQSGPTLEVYDYPTNLTVAKLTGEINVLQGQVVMGGDFYMFTTKIGGINLKCPEKLRIETEVDILIRPEHTKLVPLGKTADAKNVFSAKIDKIDFMGGLQFIELITEDKTPFFSIQNSDFSFKIGEDIDVILTRDNYTIRKR